MARTSGPILGLNIGSTTTKAVELKEGREGIELVGRPAVFPTPTEMVQGGVVVDPEGLGKYLAEMLGEAEVRTKKVVSSVSGQQSLVVRITEVPRMQVSELKEAIQWELERQTPFPVDEIIYDYAPIIRPDEDVSTPNMEVLLAVAQEEMINMHVEALAKAGLVPLHIDIEPLASARSLVALAGERYAGQTIVVVSIGAQATEISVVREGLLTFVRTIPTAGESLTRAIGQGFIVETEEAERLKRAHADLRAGQAAMGGGGPPMPGPPDTGGLDLGGGTPPQGAAPAPYQMGSDQPVFELSSTDDLQPQAAPPGDGATQLEYPAPAGAPPAPVPAAAPALDPDMEYTRRQIYDTIVPVLAELTTEVRRSLDFYRRQHRNEQIHFLALTGGTARIPGIDAFFANEVGVPAIVANPYQDIINDPDRSPAEFLRDIGPMTAVAVGLACRDMVD